MRETGTQPTARNENAVETKGAFMKITALYERVSGIMKYSKNGH